MKSVTILLGLIALFNLSKCDPAACDKYHTVAQGEDCESVQKIEKTSLLELTSANPGIDCDNLKVGSQLCIKSLLDVEDQDDDDDDDDYDEYEIEEDDGILEKRATTPKCENKNKVKIKLQYRYMNGCTLYSLQKTSARTAIHNVNGCSAQELIDLGADLTVLDKNSKALFTPACNSHDVCYGCQLGKKKCDTQFHTHMKSLCDVAYKSGSKKHTKCYSDAKTFYNMVKTFAGPFYSKAKKVGKTYDLSDNCAYCGATLVKNAAKDPFYL